jgi:hypothetical protein
MVNDDGKKKNLERRGTKKKVCEVENGSLRYQIYIYYEDQASQDIPRSSDIILASHR